MNLKVVRRSQVIYHSLLLIILTILLYLLVQVILSQESLLNVSIWLEFIDKNKLLFGISSAAFILVFYAKRLGFLFLLALSLYVISLLVLDYSTTGNKGILIAGFFYFTCSYFVLMSYFYELKSPPFSPDYVSAQIDNRFMPSIPISGVDEAGNKYEGMLSKVSGDSLFSIDDLPGKIKGRLQARISFEDNEYSCELIEVTRTNFGRGFKVGVSEINSPFSWYNFYKVLSDRGYYFE